MVLMMMGRFHNSRRFQESSGTPPGDVCSRRSDALRRRYATSRPPRDGIGVFGRSGDRTTRVSDEGDSGDVPFDLDAVANATHERREAAVRCVDGQPARGTIAPVAECVGHPWWDGDESAGRGAAHWKRPRIGWGIGCSPWQGRYQIGKTGRITGGRNDVDWFVRVEPPTEGSRDIGFLIITSTNRDFVCRDPDDAVYDNWVIDEPSLHEYFTESGYVVEWLD